MRRDNEELAMRTWVERNLEATTASLSKDMAVRWQRLMMRDEKLFYQLALYGFVKFRRRERQDESFPEREFCHFLGEFQLKLRLVLRGKGRANPLPLFQRVGHKALWAEESVH